MTETVFFCVFVVNAISIYIYDLLKSFYELATAHCPRYSPAAASPEPPAPFMLRLWRILRF